MNQPQTASEFLQEASHTLGERGKQYDPNGKQERSMTAIVAAFNAIYPHNLLTVHMGWQFMTLVKMVRGATKPHVDSALDQVAYAALAAEEVANQLAEYDKLQEAVVPVAEACSRIGERTLRSMCIDEGCPHHGIPHVCVNSVESPEAARARQAQEDAAYQQKCWEHGGIAGAPSYMSLQISKQALAEELGKCQHLAGVQSQEIKHLTDKLAAQQKLLEVAQHNANFYFDKTDAARAVNEDTVAKFKAERKANIAMHEEATRLRDELASRAAHCATLEQHVRSLEVQNDTLRSSFAEYACRFDLDKEYMTKERVLAGQAKHEAQVASLLNSLADSEEAGEILRGKYIAQNSRNSELQTLVDNLRSSLAKATKEGESACQELAASTQAMLSAQEQLVAYKASRQEEVSKHLRTIEGLNRDLAHEKGCVRGLEEKVQSLNNEVEAKVRELMYFNSLREPPFAHNTDEPKAVPRQYADPFDSHGGVRPKSEYRTVGSFDPDRGGLAYPQGKGSPTPL